MKLRHLFLCAIASALPALAAAQEAHSIKWVNLRAGPARDYPLVASVGPGTPLAVQGCTDGFGWCDVIGPDGVRGWVYAGNITYPYQSAEVPVISYGAMIGIPIVTFMIGSYWGSYYQDRPWFRDRGRWEHHRPPPRPVFRPPGPPRPIVRPLPGPRPPFTRPPGDNRPPGARPPGDRPPPPGARPPGRPPGDARPPGGGRPPAGGGHDRGPRPQER
ncbi:MAG: SH3 domain-containing protein [Caldimonas sp.]